MVEEKPPLVGEVSAGGRRRGGNLPANRHLAGNKNTAGCFSWPIRCRAAGEENPSGRFASLAGLRLAHHAARLGAALAFCDRCPCFVSLYPPQAALDSAAPEGEPLTGGRGKASPRRGGVCRRQTEGWEPSGKSAPCGQQKHGGMFFVACKVPRGRRGEPLRALCGPLPGGLWRKKSRKRPPGSAFALPGGCFCLAGQARVRGSCRGVRPKGARPGYLS